MNIGPLDRKALERRLVRSMCTVIPVANLVGSVSVFAYLTLSLGPPRQGEAGSPWRDVAVFGTLLAVGFPLAGAWGTRTFKRSCCWLGQDRPPTPEERLGTLRQPWRQATQPFVFWFLAAAFYLVADLVLGQHSLLHNVRLVDGILLGGVTTCALTYLLIERAFRPAYALALAGEPPERPSTLGIRPRLLLSWAVGSGVPLLGLALSPFSHEEGAASLSTTVAALAVIGLLAGLVATWAAARSVAEPLEDVRRGLARVQQGDLAVEVRVDDGGEVGLLQSGVNRMVVGLRERDRLRDLFGRHVGDDVARQALEHETGLGGEQREATALFVDLVGSTALAESRPADEVVATLNAFFGAVVRAVGDEGGWVNKFEGDGALCVFGAPTDGPDHAARALRATRALRRQLEELALVHPGLDAGIGVSSGTVVAGNVGAEQRYEYTVIGSPVNEASRLTDEAKGRPGRVLVSESTIARAGAEGDCWSPAGAVALRGRSGRTLVFEPASAGQSTKPSGVDVEDGSSAEQLGAQPG